MLDQIEKETISANLSVDFSIAVNKVDFAVALSHVQSVVEKRNIVPILSNVLIEAYHDTIKVTATDMDIIVSEVVPATVRRGGAITVDAHMLYDIVRKLDDGSDIRIDFDQEKGKISILSKNCNFSLAVLSASEFPRLDDEHYEYNFSIQAHELQKLIDECKFSISAEETRYNLNGVYMHSNNGYLRMVSTDGHRLCCSDSISEFEIKELEGVIIPKKSIMEVGKIVDSLGGNINIGVSDNKIKFSNNNFILVSKLISAKFPDYQSLMPEDNKIVVEIPAKDFSRAVDRVSIITNEKFKGLKFEIEGNQFTISSKNDDGSFATEVITVQCNTSGRFEVGFNARYISDVMSVIRGEKIIFKFKDNFSPAVISDISNDKFQYIIMPMRV